MRQGLVLFLCVAVAAVVVGLMRWGSDARKAATVIVDVRVPELTGSAANGAPIFQEHCAACHGENAAGSDAGPPLVHPIYRPNHHADITFRLAMSNGVRAHHWTFGDMPQQPQIGEADIEMIIAYVRRLQRANGIR